MRKKNRNLTVLTTNKPQVNSPPQLSFRNFWSGRSRCRDNKVSLIIFLFMRATSYFQKTVQIKTTEKF